MPNFTAVSPSQTGNKPKNIKSNNQKIVLSLLRSSDALSLSEIAAQVNLSKTTITKIVNALMEKGLVHSIGKGSSTEEGGKRPELFAFCADYKYIVVLELGGHSIRGALVNMSCKTKAEHQYFFSSSASYEESISATVTVIRELLKEGGIAWKNLCGIAIGCGGIVDSQNGILRFAMHNSWGSNLPIVEDLKKKIEADIPIYVDNSCRFFGYAEINDSCNQNQAGSCVTIYTSGSTGGSLLLNHNMLHGNNGFIGEFGHIIVDPTSRIQCSCGGYGCFETMVSTKTLIENAYHNYKSYPDSLLYQKCADGTLKLQDIFDASNKGDPFSCDLINDIAKYFSILIHNIILLHDPQNVIIQGPYTQAGDYFINTLRRKMDAFPFYKIKRHLNISYSSMDPVTALFYGASLYAVDTFFKNEKLYD